MGARAHLLQCPCPILMRAITTLKVTHACMVATPTARPVCPHAPQGASTQDDEYTTGQRPAKVQQLLHCHGTAFLSTLHCMSNHPPALQRQPLYIPQVAAGRKALHVPCSLHAPSQQDAPPSPPRSNADTRILPRLRRWSRALRRIIDINRLSPSHSQQTTARTHPMHIATHNPGSPRLASPLLILPTAHRPTHQAPLLQATTLPTQLAASCSPSPQPTNDDQLARFIITRLRAAPGCRWRTSAARGSLPTRPQRPCAGSRGRSTARPRAPPCGRRWWARHPTRRRQS